MIWRFKVPDNLTEVIGLRQRSIDRKTHRAFESTPFKTSVAQISSVNMKRSEVVNSNAPSRWQRVKRDKLAVTAKEDCRR